MQFHETVIPKEESLYDYYPILDEENGKYVHNAALVLNSTNVQRFVFTDLKVKRSLYALSCYIYNYSPTLFTNQCIEKGILFCQNLAGKVMDIQGHPKL